MPITHKMYATKASFMEYHTSQISQEHWSIQHPLRSPRIAPPQWKIGSAKLAGKFTEAYLTLLSASSTRGIQMTFPSNYQRVNLELKQSSSPHKRRGSLRTETPTKEAEGVEMEEVA
jgi:hypothetical protein